jgi:hypothetical protein
MQSFGDLKCPARDKMSPRDTKCPSDISGTPSTELIRDGSQARSLFYIMPRKRKHCPICGKRNLLKVSTHLADIHELSSVQRQPFLIRAKVTP